MLSQEHGKIIDKEKASKKLKKKVWWELVQELMSKPTQNPFSQVERNLIWLKDEAEAKYRRIKAADKRNSYLATYYW